MDAEPPTAGPAGHSTLAGAPAPGFAVRPATDADGPAIARVIETVFAFYPHCFLVPEEVPELSAVASHYARGGGAIWAAIATGPDGSEDRIVGSLAVAGTRDPAVFELFKVYLLPEARGRGLASVMLGTALAHARAAGARRLRLWSDTKFVEGHAFYRRAGFRQIAAVRYLADISLTWEYGFERPVDPDAAGPEDVRAR